MENIIYQNPTPKKKEKEEKPPAKEKIKSKTSQEDIKNQIDFLNKYKINYTVKLSNYTTTIETPSQIYSWNDNDLDTRAFIAYQMIKRDLKEYTANEYPTIERESLQFFESYMNKPVNYSQAFCIDIKSAYANNLFLDGFICEKTFIYLNSLDKTARLAAVGMLASRKDIFIYEGENLISHDKIINPLENYFWYCVKRTAEIMHEIASATQPLFYWVDGIYFADIDNLNKAAEILEINKYSYSKKNCFLFQAETRENKKNDILNDISFYECKNMALEYRDAQKKDLEYKIFSIPLRQQLRKKLIEFLTQNK